MSMVIVGECAADNRYELVDPTASTEADFENHVARALMCYRPGFLCAPFHGTFTFDRLSYRPDLALVAKDASHWFVVEVELASHSLDGHVIPQVRALRYGEPRPDCVESLAQGLGIQTAQAQQLLQNVPRRVAVVANKRLSEWYQAFRGIEVDFLSVAVYQAATTGTYAYEVDGTLAMTVASIGFGTYSAVDRAIVFPRTVNLPAGTIQIIDPYDGVGFWLVTHAANRTWAVKASGDPGYVDGGVVQLLRTFDGLLTMRRAER